MKVFLSILSLFVLGGILTSLCAEGLFEKRQRERIKAAHVKAVTDYWYESIDDNSFKKKLTSEKIKFKTNRTKYNYEYYGKSGNLLRTEFYNSDTITVKYFYSYDKKGNNVATMIKNSQNKVFARYKYYFDGNSNMIKSERIENGKIVLTNILKYDDKGNCIESTFLHPQMKDLIVKYSYKFNKKNQLIEKNSIYQDGKILKEIYKYDRRGNLINEMTFINDKFDYKISHRYNSKGLETESLFWSDVHVSLSKYSYQYY